MSLAERGAHAARGAASVLNYPDLKEVLAKRFGNLMNRVEVLGIIRRLAEDRTIPDSAMEDRARALVAAWVESRGIQTPFFQVEIGEVRSEPKKPSPAPDLGFGPGPTREKAEAFDMLRRLSSMMHDAGKGTGPALSPELGTLAVEWLRSGIPAAFWSDFPEWEARLPALIRFYEGVSRGEGLRIRLAEAPQGPTIGMPRGKLGPAPTPEEWRVYDQTGQSPEAQRQMRRLGALANAGPVGLLGMAVGMARGADPERIADVVESVAPMDQALTHHFVATRMRAVPESPFGRPKQWGAPVSGSIPAHTQVPYFPLNTEGSVGEIAGHALGALRLDPKTAVQLTGPKETRKMVRDFLLGSGVEPGRVWSEPGDRPKGGRPVWIGESTAIIARAFTVDPVKARAQLRASALGGATVSPAITAYAEQALSSHSGKKKVLVWVRARSDYQPERNTSDVELRAMIEKVKEQGFVPVLVGSDPPPGTSLEGAVPMTRHWQAPAIKNAPDPYRAQLLLFEHLREAHNVVGQVGVRSGGLDPPALLGMPTVYIETAPAGDPSSARMKQWVGPLGNYEMVQLEPGWEEALAKKLSALKGR